MRYVSMTTGCDFIVRAHGIRSWGTTGAAAVKLPRAQMAA